MFHKDITCTKSSQNSFLSQTKSATKVQNQRTGTTKSTFPKKVQHQQSLQNRPYSASCLGVSKRFLQTNKVIVSQSSNSNSKYMSHQNLIFSMSSTFVIGKFHNQTLINLCGFNLPRSESKLVHEMREVNYITHPLQF